MRVGCITEYDPDDKPWCSTKVNPRTNEHINGNWGHCGSSCPRSKMFSGIAPKADIMKIKRFVKKLTVWIKTKKSHTYEILPGGVHASPHES